jgi:voltage-gated potassium channel
MRFIVGMLSSVMRTRRQRRNLRMLGWLAAAFLAQITLFSCVFHWLMDREGQRHSWITSVSRFIERYGRRHPGGA